LSLAHEQHALLSAILATAVDAIIVIDDRGMIHSFNAATERMFGYAADDMQGRNILMLMPSPQRDEHDEYLNRYHQTGVKRVIGIGREVTGQRKDGSTFPLHLAVSEVNLGQRKLFAGILRDISDLKHSQQQLSDLNASLDNRSQQQSQALLAAQAELLKQEKLATLGQVSGGIAHEIRNLIQTVWEETPLAPHITVETAIDENLPSAFVDVNQMPIVLRNLIRNARDAMPSGGTLGLSAHNDGDYVVIRVTDAGNGIDPQDLNRIMIHSFQPKRWAWDLAWQSPKRSSKRTAA
jgi:two-component system, LuxR family, sensor kinase FixL